MFVQSNSFPSEIQKEEANPLMERDVQQQGVFSCTFSNA